MEAAAGQENELPEGMVVATPYGVGKIVTSGKEIYQVQLDFGVAFMPRTLFVPTAVTTLTTGNVLIEKQGFKPKGQSLMEAYELLEEKYFEQEKAMQDLKNQLEVEIGYRTPSVGQAASTVPPSYQTPNLRRQDQESETPIESQTVGSSLAAQSVATYSAEPSKRSFETPQRKEGKYGISGKELAIEKQLNSEFEGEAKRPTLASFIHWCVLPYNVTEENPGTKAWRISYHSNNLLKTEKAGDENRSMLNMLSGAATKVLSPLSPSKTKSSEELYIEITVVDEMGHIMGRSGWTPKTNIHAPMYIVQGETEEPRYAFLQLKRLKRKKGSVKPSEVCNAFVKLDKAWQGKRHLKLYKKPVDFTRTKLREHSRGQMEVDVSFVE